MEFLPLAVLLALVKKAVDFVKFVTARQWSSVITQLLVWAAGVGATFLAANSQWGAELGVGDFELSDLNWASLVLVGLSLGSASSLIHDLVRAVDNHDTAATPALIPSSVTDERVPGDVALVNGTPIVNDPPVYPVSPVLGNDADLTGDRDGNPLT